MTDQRFRLISCDKDGQPTAPLGALPPMLIQNCQGTAALYREIGFEPPWVGYIAAVGDDAVGGGAFVGAPENGEVEIAYFTLAEFEGRGFARQTATGLISILDDTAPGVAAIAKTLPEENASTRILQGLGFEHAEDVVDEDVGMAWLWRRAPGTSF